MKYQIIFKSQDNPIITNSLYESVEVINRFIKTQSICSFPVSRNIVANWTSRSKSNKYNFVEIVKL
jgi:hypothetical protein